MLQRSWKRWSLIFGGWTLFGVFFAFQACLNNAYFGRPLPVGRTLVVWLSCAYIWAVLTPLIIRLARQFPVERGTYVRGLTVHLLAGALVSLLQLGTYIFVRQWLLGDPSKTFSPLKSFQNILVAEFHANLLLYWSVVGLSHAYEYVSLASMFRRQWRKHGRLSALADGALSWKEIAAFMGRSNSLIVTFNARSSWQK